MINELTKQFIKLRYEGEKCPVEEAKEWLAKGLDKYKDRMIMAMQILIRNLSEGLEMRLMDEEEYQSACDDLEYVMNLVIAYKEYTRLIRELQDKPEQYAAWKGKVNDKTAYYIERLEREDGWRMYS